MNQLKTSRVIIYCQSLNMCSDLFAHFLFELGSSSYYPPGAPQLSDNRLFGMYHASTPKYNKEVIQTSLSVPDGIVRVVFATVALGMGINFQNVNLIIHYVLHEALKTTSRRVDEEGEVEKMHSL